MDNPIKIAAELLCKGEPSISLEVTYSLVDIGTDEGAPIYILGDLLRHSTLAVEDTNNSILRTTFQGKRKDERVHVRGAKIYAGK